MDLVSLQDQTRIWLGQVLGTRLDEDIHISDLLQDGEILFQVSKVIWELNSTQCMELECGPFVSKRSRGRYRPYCNVDSFLKVCKILGMNSIDLFSPSDVVEKRDIKKVCICIRTLAKKAKSKELSVPDFNVVIYAADMPTVMVGEILRSLESSPCTTPTSSISYKKKLSLKSLLDDSNYEESDEAESRSNFDLDDAQGGEEMEVCSSTNTSSILGTDIYSLRDEMEKLPRILCTSTGLYKSETLEESLSSVSCDSPQNEFPPCEDKGILTVSYIRGATCDESEDKLVSSTAEDEKQDETRQTLDIPLKHTIDSSGRKSGPVTILKTIVKGTAIAGAIFLLSNFRKSMGTNANQMKQPSEAPVTKESNKSTLKKQQIVSRKKIYPVDKLKF